ncbi:MULTISPECIES: ROK family protein [Methylobacterium]|jgi:hypothetical protein|uniref:Glucokinase n=3 Tax=Pseudomonadota TaxID=1224 RepID=A0ABQ4SXM1_9HYPH|nr:MULTISPECIES: ROK family protein [Methylobacterium]PIU04999.1 MAG: glucokinase [Methylobacterium sp. CG09_land_8_20_14_0_10_71_15]PIU11500.1 MAG: glucokinase [Methylobacterium sp. CG08_land_8_20_14_0_20_71_15]GBU16567.1 glucokinase [Methylobacterium sp.]GJE07627.1 hypothetical protein AOPFMNJM_2956 [Methylobacterium jeotgali]
MSEGNGNGQQGIAHGGTELPSVIVDDYNIELSNEEGFIGDRVSKGAFRDLVEDWREKLRQVGDDPLGDVPSREIGKKRLDKHLLSDDPLASGVVFGAIEGFAQELATVARRFLRQKGWKDTQAIVVGGGFSDSRAGHFAIGRAGVILRAGGIDVSLRAIANHPDEAGLIGAAHLAPAWIFNGYDSLLAVDIGGTNIRAGVLVTNRKRAPDLSRTEVWRSDLWRHRDEDPQPSREEAVKRLARMLKGLIRRAERSRLKLAPFIGVGCPGLIESDGSIARGGQNLPGNWESSRFHLPSLLSEAIPEIGGHETMVLMHNDAVVQGLSEIPRMGDYERWGVLTVGTGLGNARFTARRREE